MEDLIKNGTKEEYTCLCSSSNLTLFLETSTYMIYGSPKEGNEIILKYRGKLVNNINSSNMPKCIYLNYGYGNAWNDRVQLKMDKCALSDDDLYCIKFKVAKNDTIYFCFMDNSNNWDLESNCNSYSIQVLEKEDIITKSDLPKDLYLVNSDFDSKLNALLNKVKCAILGLFRFLGNAFK